MRFGVITCILIIIVSASLLISGSEALGWAINKDPYIPLGNVLTWLSVIALPCSMYLGIKRVRMPQSKLDRVFKALVIVGVVFGVLWYPVSWYLADNFSGSFGGGGPFRGSARAGEYYWHYTYAVVGYPLILWAFHLVLRLFRK
jgi:hypothetical protein